MFLVVRLLVRRSCMGFFSCRRKCGILRLRECGIGSEQQGREHIEGEFFFFFFCFVLSCVQPPWEHSSREGFFFSLRMDAGMGGSKNAFRYSHSYFLSFFLLAVKNEKGTDKFN